MFKNKINIISKQHFVGTAEYMAPEIITNKEIGTYTDLWSFGCIIYQMFMGHSPFHDKTEYLIFQNILNLKYKIDPNKIPEDAQDLIRSLLKIDPVERLGSGLNSDNTLEKLKSHKFFTNFDFNKYLEILELYSRPRSDGNNNENSNHHKDDEEKKKREISQSEKLLHEENFTNEGKILKIGVLKKKSPWFFYDKRKVILYNTPRIDYIEPNSNVLKGSIILDTSCKAELIDNITFDLITPKRIYNFKCKKKFDIAPWVTAINDAIKNYSK
jgi:serine/threonine protein kinase